MHGVLVNHLVIACPEKLWLGSDDRLDMFIAVDWDIKPQTKYVLSVLQAQGKQQGGFSLSGMKKALFGEDTQEQRELKIKHLDEQIKITQAELKQINEDYQ